MKIDNSLLHFTANHSLVARNEEKEALRAWVGARRPNFEAAATALRPANDTVTISDAGRQALAQAQDSTQQSGSCDKTKLDTEQRLSPKLQLIKQIIEKMTGQKIKVTELQEFQASDLHLSFDQQSATAVQSGTPQQAGWGVEYDYDAVHYEAEVTTFSAQGIVKTKDGQEINFSLNLQMSREFYSEEHLRVREGDAAKDPLVINFDGTAAQLTSSSFEFDLDVDGTAEKLPTLTPNSGLLVFDKNGDGQVNDGTELFGPQSGDGFTELAAYDADGNQWIDEADPIFQQLYLWRKDDAGQDLLTSLAQAKIGALALAHSETPFALKDAANATLGQVRDSGVYLREDGTAGTIQQVDLVVS